MDIIDRIEIKHFRSFDGGSGRPQVRIDELSDLNVFSGANDSGKSNVLRALNLFFNNEISPGVKFDKNRDFSKIVSIRFDEEIAKKKKDEESRLKKIKEETGIDEKARDLRRSDEVVTVKLFFNNYEKQRGLPEYFWVSKVYSKRNNFEGEFRYQGDLNRAQTTTFLNSFRFEYVPAIKDRQYFQYLFSRLQKYLFEKSDKSEKNRFSDSSEKFNDILKSETEGLFTNFMKSSGVEASFYIPSTLVDFFRTLSVRTENEISLFERGDGVQARFIPEIIHEICQGSGRNIVWGFEEPENSYEAKNIRKLRDEFLFKYSRPYQIFLTTHTKEFLALRRNYTKSETAILEKGLSAKKTSDELRGLRANLKSSEVSIYRVWKTERFTSLVTRFDENNNVWEETCDDLGIVQEARIIDDLQQKLDDQLNEIKASKLNQEQQVKVYSELEDEYKRCLDKLQSAESKIDEYLKPILVVEDKYEAIYKIAYLKSQKIKFVLDKLNEEFDKHAPFVIRRAEGAGSVGGFLSMNNTDGYEDKKVIGLFDYDEAGCENFYQLKKRANGAWKGGILGDKRTGYHQKRSDHSCFYAMLLPIPERLEGVTSDITNGVFSSHVEIENLLPEKTLLDLNCVDVKQVYQIEYYKVRDNIKSKAIDKFGNLEESEFLDFEPLFITIHELFDLDSDQ